MKKGFKWFFLGTTTLCMTLSMLPPAHLYTVKAEDVQLEEIKLEETDSASYDE